MTDDIELTDEEVNKVNEIITGIKSDLEDAIKEINRSNYEKALLYIESGINKSNCPICKRELSILASKIRHNKEMCILKADSCVSDKDKLIEDTEILKEDFIPIKTKKKAIIEKRKSIEEKTLLFFPLPHMLFKKKS